jgi:glycosyltransferase involved in cell wall biosynthesis
MKRKRVICTVTNDLNFDQRMIRICTSLANGGYDVTLVGFKRRNSTPLVPRPFKQVRLPIIAEKGKLLYADFWVKLFFYLLFVKVDILCAIDLDTIIPVYEVSKIRRKKRVYDAHELFTELQEVVTRPLMYKAWRAIEKYTVPNFPVGYTVGAYIAQEFNRRYGVNYKLVRNMTVLKPLTIQSKDNRFILYQGAVNVGRCFEYLIPAMRNVPINLIVCGAGNFYKEARELTEEEKLQERVLFKGYVPPDQLKDYTLNAYIGITLFEAIGPSNKMSLANRFFDYMHSGVPQLCMKYPEYEKINEAFEVAYLIDEPTPEKIAAGLNFLLTNEEYYKRLQQNCLKAREKYCWQEEEKTLLKLYSEIAEA